MIARLFKLRCFYCGDTGICSHCDGSGQKECCIYRHKKRVPAYKTCPKCRGSGICKHCNGK